MISVQMAPQIRMVQNNDSLMAEKIRTSIVNTIPLWKNQMVMAMSLYHSEQAMKAQREVTNVTNELLQKNAQTLLNNYHSVALGMYEDQYRDKCVVEFNDYGKSIDLVAMK